MDKVSSSKMPRINIYDESGSWQIKFSDVGPEGIIINHWVCLSGNSDRARLEGMYFGQKGYSHTQDSESNQCFIKAYILKGDPVDDGSLWTKIKKIFM
jgi:hypothetical protein